MTELEQPGATSQSFGTTAKSSGATAFNSEQLGNREPDVAPPGAKNKRAPGCVRTRFSPFATQDKDKDKDKEMDDQDHDKEK